MKVLIIDSTHPLLEETLRKNGFELVDGTGWNKEEVLENISDFTGVVVRSKFPLDEAFFRAATSLKCIGRFGAGLENIDLDAAERHNVTCFNVPEGNRQAVAEHALALLLNLMNHIRIADIEVRHGLWKRHENTGEELSGKTVGIIGLGNMGSAFANVLRGFNVQLLANDPYKTDWPENIKSVSLDELASKADVVSIHVPLTEETRGMINETFFNRLDKPIYFLNTARGPVLKTQDLLKALDRGQVKGAGLDVLEFESSAFKLQIEENPVFQKLVQDDRVLLSPHIGGWTVEAFEKMALHLAEKMIKHLKS
ncbi:MAG: hydroxyacid dehydrogenase [Bacteroidetes bacterium]|nr:MAG: hydroxyacid dehydrogenase [Bacteroidota bacterium]